MPDPETESLKPEPMQKTVVRQSSGTGDGTIGVAGAYGPTPTAVESMPVWRMLLVRVARAYVESVLGLLTLDGFGAIEFASAAGFFPHLYVAAQLALGPAAYSLILNGYEYLKKLDVTAPQWRA